jgi:hypothetical protein
MKSSPEGWRRDENFVFFKIAPGYGGHTQNPALFEASNLNSWKTKRGEPCPFDAPPHCVQYFTKISGLRRSAWRIGAESECDRA